MAQPQLSLASQSPRRCELLAQLGVTFELIPVDVDESPHENEVPRAYVERLAVMKAQTGWTVNGGALPVLGADTAVVLDELIMGKPVDKADGLAMLAQLSGRVHNVYTAVAMRSDDGLACRVNLSSVTFRELSDAECKNYWRTGEPADKAGAYAIQGLAAVFIDDIRGSYSGVMGLPLFETAELLAGIGIAPL